MRSSFTSILVHIRSFLTLLKWALANVLSSSLERRKGEVTGILIIFWRDRRRLLGRQRVGCLCDFQFSKLVVSKYTNCESTLRNPLWPSHSDRRGVKMVVTSIGGLGRYRHTKATLPIVLVLNASVQLAWVTVFSVTTCVYIISSLAWLMRKSPRTHMALSASRMTLALYSRDKLWHEGWWCVPSPKIRMEEAIQRSLLQLSYD